MSNLQKVTVLGGGVLGSQIAWHSAFKGKDVVVFDISGAALDRCRAAHEQYAAIYLAEVGATDRDIADTRSRLTYTTVLSTAAAGRDLVIEAVPEIPDLKTQVYREMALLLSPDTLVATNSSTLLPRDFADVTGRPAKYCAMHFANMIWAMNVLEIMAHPGTADDTLVAVTEYAIEIGMIPIPVRKEQNGYVLNTWFVQLLNASQTLVTNGIATPEDIDRTYLIANPGAPRGPMGAFDVVGMETAYNVVAHWGSVTGDEQMLANARYIKEHFLDKGKLGLQTGEGYYTYPDPAYADPGFLAVPDISQAADIAALARPH
ncbi:3-hydroxyacyl-CoA dehydrogenase [Nocardia sp. NPDC046763]|uniref:3-hydroxyacyl-CoA dehydrogenase n=1 Tax=Nocardia sp. NPDC046763 TaxID=3155256 RepID=UPI0033F13BEF